MHPGLCVQESNVHGVGVFSKTRIPANTLIESCPIILFHSHTLKALHEAFEANHILGDYVFHWEAGFIAAVLGYGMVYNHSKDPNVMYRKNRTVPSMEFLSLRDIEENEELFTSYYYGETGKILEFDDLGQHVIPGQIDKEDLKSQFKSKDFLEID